MGAITVSNYAKQCGISVQAVNQTIRRYKKDLEGHINRQGNVRYLDDEAVTFLNDHRKYANTLVEEAPQKEVLADAEVLTKLTKAYETIIALQGENATLLKENTELKLLIATKKEEDTTTEATESPTQAEGAEGVVKDTEEAEAPQKATEEATEDVKVDAEATEAPSDVPTKKLNRLQRAWKAFTSKE